MFHPYRKDSSYLRAAIFSSYKEKCVYCGRTIQQRDMHVDHVIPSNMEQCYDDEIEHYLEELKKAGFISDSIENYLPSCPACNINKSNHTFTVSSLRFYHETARVHVEQILQIINKLKNDTEEFFYSPIDADIWERLDFSYQRSISHAIMGYRLTPADVMACPQFPQVKRITEQLMLVDYVVVQGETGAGKSISLYQAAYDLFRKGWHIYRYKSIDNQSPLVIPHNSEPSLYLIDDAHQLSDKIIDKITEQARPNAKILLAKTISSALHHDTILLTNRDSVKILYNDFLARKQEITPIVHQCDNHVGINFLDLPIERRLDGAKKATTPWQFNYILRGGWKTMKEQYQTICAHHNCGLLAAAIALFQIVDFDNSVDFDQLCNFLQHLDAALIWDAADLQYLVDQKVVLSTDEVRIVHMESAAVIIAQFLQYSSLQKKQLLYNVAEVSFLNKDITPLGLVWLCNIVQRYSHFYCCDETFISEKMIASALEHLQNVEVSQERANIALFMEKVFTMTYEKNGQWYFSKHEALIIDWITHANSETAYAYSRLVNTVYNTDKKRHRQFARKIGWMQMMQCMLEEERPDLYAWGELWNRTACSLFKHEQAPIAEILQRLVKEILPKITVSAIPDFSEFLCSVAFLIPICVHETIRTLLPLYKEYFKKDMAQAIYLFDFDFFLYICGMSLLGEYKASKEESKTAAALVEILPVSELASTISNSLPRDWQRIHQVMSLIEQYDAMKANAIITSVDMAKLTDIVKDCWSRPEELWHICRILQIGDDETAGRFIEDNQNSIQDFYPFLAMIAPQYAIRKFNEGIPIEFAKEHRWTVHSYTLYRLIETDKLTAGAILSANLSAVIDKLNAVSYVDFENDGCLDFLQLVSKHYTDIYQKILLALNLEKISSSLEKSHMSLCRRKRISSRYHRFLKLITQSP